MKGFSPFLGMLEKCVTRDLDLEAVEELGVVGRVDVVGPHDERVLVEVGVVALADADGFLFLVDRAKDMIITGGENVYPAETERVLAAHPAVSQAAVIGVPDPEWGESVLAVVVASAPVTGDELIEYCRHNLASFKAPTRIEFRDDLPKLPTGKVLRRVLKEDAKQLTVTN